MYTIREETIKDSFDIRLKTKESFKFLSVTCDSRNNPVIHYLEAREDKTKITKIFRFFQTSDIIDKNYLFISCVVINFYTYQLFEVPE